ncbi:hypothetical protein HHK36_008517 [Tetracentron sinense]|uniref:Uncharacterized protein n=1 Tax=Tetracentron sinense TaxID=13715 RepID=A0A834ZFP2_TETSI|nr:hypothetical protein HHK36_008517 [Tetracentron sinense]
MLHAIKLVRTQPQLFLSSPFPSQKIIGVRFRQAKTVSMKPENQDNMEKTQNQNEKTGDVMSHSYGEGYSTRSDEEGFGGNYSGNQSLPKPDEDKDKIVHESYDKTQGSELIHSKTGIPDPIPSNVPSISRIKVSTSSSIPGRPRSSRSRRSRGSKGKAVAYIEHSFLSIDRKIFVKYRTLDLISKKRTVAHGKD